MKLLKFIPVLIVLVLISCRHKEPEEKKSEKYCLTDSLLASCTIDTAKLEGVTNELSMPGRVSFNEDHIVKVVALASGHVQEVKVSLGDYVKQGQVLAVVKSSDMAGYYNDFVVAKSNLAITKKNLEAAEGFYKSGLNSEKELIVAQKEYQNALSSFNKINEIIKVYGGNGNPDESTPASYVIKAPIEGFIVDKTIVNGMEIRNDNNTGLFTISSLQDVWVIANLYETDIAKVLPGYIAEITTISYKDKIYYGTVDKVSNVLDPETKALGVRIHLNNPNIELKPGMFARITVKYNDAVKMLSVPKNSVVFDENRNFVVKYNEKCDVRMLQVNVVKSYGNRVYVEGVADSTQAKLNEGDRVITRNSLFVFTALKKL